MKGITSKCRDSSPQVLKLKLNNSIAENTTNVKKITYIKESIKNLKPEQKYQNSKVYLLKTEAKRS